MAVNTGAWGDVGMHLQHRGPDAFHIVPWNFSSTTNLKMKKTQKAAHKDLIQLIYAS